MRDLSTLIMLAGIRQNGLPVPARRTFSTAFEFFCHYFAMLNGVRGREIFGDLWVIGPIKRCVVGSESGGG